MPEGKLIRGLSEWEFHVDGKHKVVGRKTQADDVRDTVRKLKKSDQTVPGLTFNIEFDGSYESPENIRLANGADPDAAIDSALQQVAELQERQKALRQEEERQEAEAQRPQRMLDSGEFYNPYSFVQGLNREGVAGELGDAAPRGHHCLHADALTGWIDVELTTKTPLLIPDAETRRRQDGNEQHSIFAIRSGCDMQPYFPPTSLKGVLSSAYEAVTNSRLRMLNKHSRRLGKRMRSTDGARLVPARIENGLVHLLTGANTTKDMNADGSPRGIMMYGAWLPRYVQGGPMQYSGAGHPEHGDSVDCWVEEFEHWQWSWKTRKYSHNFDFLRVREIVRSGTSKLSQNAPQQTLSPPRQNWNAGNNYYVSKGMRTFTGGYVCITNHNIQKKHDERVFFGSPIAAGPASDLEKNWKELITDYQEVHRDEILEQGVSGPPQMPGRVWSRHIGDGPGRTLHTDERELGDGTLCYVRVNRVGPRWKATEIYPVNISRELFPEPPCNLIHDSLKPAQSIKELSPADRVFGWVHQDAEAGRSSSSGPVAWKGQLHIDRIVCNTPDAIAKDLGNDRDGIPLTVLSEPKPAQASFYVSEGNGKPVNQKNSGYRKGQQLRHRKVYPHPASVADNDEYWSDQNTGQPREFRRYNDERDSQNRSITEWVKPETEFTTRIHVTNLSPVELGALLWLLSLDQQYEGQQHYLRAGGGKPLGFGSLSVKITGTDLRAGSKWKTYYQDLDDTADEINAQQQASIRNTAIESYRTAVLAGWPDASAKRTFETVSFIEAWLTAARGFEAPVHYPRTSPTQDANTKIYDWFKKGNRPLPILKEFPERLRHE